MQSRTLGVLYPRSSTPQPTSADASPPAADKPAAEAEAVEVKRPKWISGRGGDVPSWKEKKDETPKVEVSRSLKHLRGCAQGQCLRSRLLGYLLLLHL